MNIRGGKLNLEKKFSQIEFFDVFCAKTGSITAGGKKLGVHGETPGRVSAAERYLLPLSLFSRRPPKKMMNPAGEQRHSHVPPGARRPIRLTAHVHVNTPLFSAIRRPFS